MMKRSIITRRMYSACWVQGFDDVRGRLADGPAGGCKYGLGVGGSVEEEISLGNHDGAGTG